jgi:hypothetical protein
MLRKAVCAAAVVALAFGVAVAEEITGRITKIEDGKITVAEFDKETKKLAQEKTYPLAKNVKVVNAKFNKEEKKVESGGPLEGGLKNERFQKIGEGGIFAVIVTNDAGQVAEIRLLPQVGKKKAPKGKDRE